MARTSTNTTMILPDLMFRRASTRVARPWLLALLLCAAPGVHAQETGAPPRFDVFEFRVEGNTVLEAGRIERAVYPFLGERRSVEDVEAARVALEAAYRDAGYGTVVVDTPEQRIVDAIVVLQVNEAPISRLRVLGSRYFSQGRILQSVPALAEGKVPNFSEASAQLAGVNRSADRRVTPVLRPGKEPGTTEADLTVEDRLPLHGSVEINNRYSPNTTKSRLLASLRYDNLWQRDHSVGLQVQVSPEDTSEVKVFAGTYTVPLTSGLLVASLIRSRSSAPTGVGDTTVFGRGTIAGLRWVQILENTENSTRTLTLGADYKDIEETIGFDGAPVSYVPMSVSYALTSGDKQGRWQFGGGLTFALREFASSERQFADKRYRASGNFTILKFDATRTQPLFDRWTLVARVDAHLADQALISNEQFVAGGVDSVRGYLEAIAVGDKGLRASLEVRSANLLPEKGWGWLGDARWHAFVEGAGLWLNDPLPGQDKRSGLVGTGVGLRVKAREFGSLALDLAWPLRDAGVVRKGDARLHASGSIEF